MHHLVIDFNLSSCVIFNWRSTKCNRQHKQNKIKLSHILNDKISFDFNLIFNDRQILCSSCAILSISKTLSKVILHILWCAISALPSPCRNHMFIWNLNIYILLFSFIIYDQNISIDTIHCDCSVPSYSCKTLGTRASTHIRLFFTRMHYIHLALVSYEWMVIIRICRSAESQLFC